MKESKITEFGKEYTIKVCTYGTKYWHLNGELHRENGPAIERTNGSKYWYLNGEYLTKKQFNNQKISKEMIKIKITKRFKNALIKLMESECDMMRN